jgi:hypothetical protein
MLNKLKWDTNQIINTNNTSNILIWEFFNTKCWCGWVIHGSRMVKLDEQNNTLYSNWKHWKNFFLNKYPKSSILVLILCGVKVLERIFDSGMQIFGIKIWIQSQCCFIWCCRKTINSRGGASICWWAQTDVRRERVFVCCVRARQQGEQSAPRRKLSKHFLIAQFAQSAESIFADKVIFPLPGRLRAAYTSLRAASLALHDCARVIIQKTAYNSLVCALAIMRWQPHTHTL